MKKFLVATLCVYSLGCTSEQRSPVSDSKNSRSVIEGVLLENEAITKNVVGLYSISLGSICTGTLIDKNLILTAAHCVTNDPKDTVIAFNTDAMVDMMSVMMNVYMGEPIDSLTYYRSALDVIIHEKYNSDSVTTDEEIYDLALVTFNGEAPHNYAPLKIAANNTRLIEGEELTVVGYGVSKIESVEITKEEFESLTKQQEDIAKKIQENPDAEENLTPEENELLMWQAYGTETDFIKIKSSEPGNLRQGHVRFSEYLNIGDIVTESGTTLGPCSGDSGGPLLIKNKDHYEILAVASRASIQCDALSLYTDITNPLSSDWITKNRKLIKTK